MKYENLSYQQMLQVLKEAAICRLAAVYNGTPCVRPLCYTLQMDGCIPVLQLQLTHDGQLLAALRAYLWQRYTPRQVESILMHEVIHWLRLMPYKLSKDKKRAAMFYAGLVMVANDVAKEFPKEGLC